MKRINNNQPEQVILTRSELNQTKQYADPKTFVKDTAEALEVPISITKTNIIT
jgi:hypothetical protein